MYPQLYKEFQEKDLEVSSCLLLALGFAGFDAWKESKLIITNGGLMVIYHGRKYKITLNTQKNFNLVLRFLFVPFM